jgi:hypothetical protein
MPVISNPVSALEVLVKDNWMVIEQNNKPVGLRHHQLRRTDTGYKYIIDSSFQLTSPDGEPTQFTRHWELSVDKQYLVKAFQLINETNGSITHTNGEVANHQVKLKRIATDGQESPDYYQIEGPLYFFSSYTDYISLSGQLQAGRTYQAPVFDLDTLKPLAYSFTADKSDGYKYQGKNIQLFSLTQPEDQNPAVLLNSKGEYYRWFDSASKLTYVKIERNDIRGINELPALHFLIAGNARITDALRSVFSQIRINWSDVSRNEFHWEDNRQKLTDPNETPAKNEVLVTIQMEDRDFTGKISIPVTGAKKLAPYLANDPVITPSLATVKKVAGEILGGETDGWRATQKLVSWVYNAIRPGVNLRNLTTERILNQKKGQSLEYAILFAALARSAGIPTRIAWGERYRNEIWMEHTWNEVWLGEWIAVDAFYNQIVPDSLLLKLFHSDSALEIQKFRAKMLASLDITIEEVRVSELDETDISTVKTGIYGQTYLNREFHCCIKAPDAWRIIETSEADLPVLVMQSRLNKDITGILIMFNLSAGTSAEQALGARLPELREALAQYDQAKQQSDTAGKELASLGDNYLTNNERRFHQQNWLMIHGDTGYLLVLLAPDEIWADCENDFLKIKDNFKIINFY